MKCLYCKCEISNESPVGVCERCGIKVWGEKMFNTIVNGMKTETEKGNMDLGRVGEGSSVGSAGNIQEMHRVIKDSKRNRPL